MVAGPEKRTLVERVIGLLPLPYLVSSILMLLLWTLGDSLAIGYFNGLTPLDNVAEWIALVLSPGYAVFLLFIFYVFYVPHYMRVRLLESENSISSLLPNGEEDFHRIFGRVSALKPALMIWVFLMVGIGLLFSLAPGPANPPPALVLLTITVGNLVVLALFTLGMSSLIWAYVSSLGGIRRMGSMELRFHPFHKDRHLGLRPVGSLTLFLVLVYLAFVGINVLTIVLGEPTPVSFVLPTLLLLAGLLLFFLPLLRHHQRMLEQKRLYRENLQEESTPAFEAPLKSFSQDDLSRAFLLDMRRREISAVATWPFDTSILAKLTVVVLSVAAALIARYIASLLHI